MIRTKYLLVTVLVCLFTIIGAGFFSVMPPTLSDNTIETTTIFAIPQDSYEIVKWSDTAKDSTRRAFIDRVRDSIEQDPVTTVQSAPVPIEAVAEETLTAPTAVVESVEVVPESVESTVVTSTPVPEVLPMVTTTPSVEGEATTKEVEEIPAPVM
jgi:hypothetical protein